MQLLIEIPLVQDGLCLEEALKVLSFSDISQGNQRKNEVGHLTGIGLMFEGPGESLVVNFN